MTKAWMVGRKGKVVHRETVLAEAAALEPWLLRRGWPPTTSMLIPSIRASADATIAALSACPSPDAEVQAALDKLVALRRDFGRGP